MSEHTKEVIDCGAFRCPLWFAEGLVALIALEAAAQGKYSWDSAVAKANDWLVGNGFMPLRDQPAGGKEGGK